MIKLVLLALIMFASLLSSCITISEPQSLPKIIGNPDSQYLLNKPSISEWRYELKTSTYTYLTKNLSKETYTLNKKQFNKYTLNTYWINDMVNGQRKWVFKNQEKILDENIYGYIDVSHAPDFEIR